MPKQYVRKTRDEWEIQSWTGKQYGWELESTYDNRQEARADLKVYRMGSPYPCRLVKRRVRVEGGVEDRGRGENK